MLSAYKRIVFKRHSNKRSRRIIGIPIACNQVVGSIGSVAKLERLIRGSICAIRPVLSEIFSSVFLPVCLGVFSFPATINTRILPLLTEAISTHRTFVAYFPAGEQRKQIHQQKEVMTMAPLQGRLSQYTMILHWVSTTYLLDYISGKTSALRV